jgi:osmoprotectant transport system permease protein
VQTRNWTAVTFGCVAAAALAILLDTLIAQLELGAKRRSRRHIMVAAIGLALVFGGGIAGPHVLRWIGAADTRPVVRIGGKTFVEQFILTRVMGSYLDDAGYRVELVENLGSAMVFEALRTGEIDLYVEYTGTAWANYMGRDDIVSPDRTQQLLADWLIREHGVQLVGALGFENAYALAMRQEHADELGIASIADLSRHAPGFRIGGDYEFFERPEWRRLRETYGLNFAEIVSFDSTFMYQAVAQDDVQVISAFTSEGRLAAFDLVVLDDPQQVLPPYDAVMLLSPAADSGVAAALAPLQGAIPAALMREANQKVDVEGWGLDEAAAWLRQEIDEGGEAAARERAP